nr:ferrous iron transport protein B [Candidatus Sigynarchaeota archaeon]
MPVVTRPIHVALVGNANVGKSVIFNQLTGLNQVVGNWPGKTVTWAEGRALFKGVEFKLIDLPGIYSLSTYSLEEVVTRQYLVEKHPDFIICVLNASSLERNLFFLVQLILLKAAPIIVSANQWDIAKSRGINIDFNKLGQLLGCPVIPTIAVHGRGVHELLETILNFETISQNYIKPDLRVGKEVENRVTQIEALLADKTRPYPPRFIAMKLLENDDEILGYCRKQSPHVIPVAEKLKEELENMHGEKGASIISTELYSIVHKIVGNVQTIEHSLEKSSVSEKIDHMTTHSVWGYLTLIAIMMGIYFGVFTIGGFIADSVDYIYEWIGQYVYATWGESNIFVKILWDGAMGGFLGAVGGVLPFVFLFYFFLEILQDSGYLPRVAFLMDRAMHKIGLHGKSIIPLILGFGCNVPGCAACRIMETEREKKLTMFVTTFIPCAAVATVIMGTVGRFMGLGYAFLLYVIDLAVIIIFGQIAGKLTKGESTELIIELHDFRKPNFNVIVKQTWFRGKEFVVRALPLITIIG